MLVKNKKIKIFIFFTILVIASMNTAFFNVNMIKKKASVILSLLAGSNGGAGSDDGAGVDARFYMPWGMAIDSSDNIYVADNGNYTIRKITAAGVVSTLAGSPRTSGFSDGTGSAARFSYLMGITVDSSGNVYVVDGNRIRKITQAGVVTSIAGNAEGFADGTGTAASFFKPTGIVVNSSGIIFVADAQNHRIRRVTAAGVVTTFAGTGAVGSANGAGASATFNYPNGLTIDASNNIYVAENGGQLIRKITTGAVVSTVGSLNFYGQIGIAYYSNNLYVGEASHRIAYHNSTTGSRTLLAGSATGVEGYADGTGTAASFFNPKGLVVDSSGNIFVAENSNHSIRKITQAGVVTTFAGKPGIGAVNATGEAARFQNPKGLTVDGTGNVFVADAYNNLVRKITSAGVVTTWAGSGDQDTTDGTGTAAAFDIPKDIVVNASGILYVLQDDSSGVIRKITTGKVVTTLAFSFSNDVAGGLAIDSSGVLYVTADCAIKKVTAAGAVSTFAGNQATCGMVNATGTAARFKGPKGITVDASGNVYVVDEVTVRKITSAGVVTTLAGDDGTSGYIDASGTMAQFREPQAIAVDAAGNVYVTESQDCTIRKITPAGVVTTFIGVQGQCGSTFGPIPAKILSAAGLAIKSSTLYISAGHYIAQVPLP